MMKITFKILTLAFLLSAVAIEAQNVTFTIDDATTSGSDVTETVINDGNTYVITASHSAGSGGASVFDNGGGDLLFFWQGGAANTSWEISVTENGSPISFDLVSFDFEAFVNGSNTFNVTNNNDDIITENAVVTAGEFGNFAINNVANTENIESFTITGLTENSLQFVDFHNIVIVPNSVLSVDSKNILKATIYPIPASTDITIITGSSLEKNVLIYDLQGKIIMKETVLEKLNVSSLKSGLYIMTIQEGDAVQTSKLLIR